MRSAIACARSTAAPTTISSSRSRSKSCWRGCARSIAEAGTGRPSRLLSYGPLTIDPVDHRVTVSGQTLSLTATEYRLLEYLVRRAESIVTRDQLAEYVWGGDYDPCSNVADVYVGYVRRKLQATRPQPLIHTVRGLGYMLKHEARAVMIRWRGAHAVSGAS